MQSTKTNIPVPEPCEHNSPRLLSPEDVYRLRLGFSQNSKAQQPHWRPTKRSDCEDGVRPCPYVGCRYHLFLEVDEERGQIWLNFPDVDPTHMSETCALDIADRQDRSLDQIGQYLNLSDERVRQIEKAAMAKLHKAWNEIGHK